VSWLDSPCAAFANAARHICKAQARSVAGRAAAAALFVAAQQGVTGGAADVAAWSVDESQAFIGRS